MSNRSTHLTIDDLVAQLTEVKTTRGWGGAMVTNVDSVEVVGDGSMVQIGDQNSKDLEHENDLLESDLADVDAQLRSARAEIGELETKLVAIQRVVG